VTQAPKWGTEEIVRQIEYTRQLPNPGYVHWNLSSLAANTKLQKELLRRVYTELALVPVNPGDAGPASKPSLTGEKKVGDQHMLRWSVPSGQMVSAWVVQLKRGKDWETRILPANTRGELMNLQNVSAVAVSAISRFRNQSPSAIYTP
jgi:hypothetical protein